MNDLSVNPASPDSFLRVGLSLKLALVLGQHKGTYGSTLLGWKDHAWLVCEWPLQFGHGTDIPRGTACRVSYLHDGKLVGYRSEVRDVTAVPVPLLFVAYPQAVETMQLRKHTRVLSCEPVLLERLDGGAWSGTGIPSQGVLGGLLQDLSRGGCRIVLTRPPAWIRSGARVRMEFELVGLGHVTNLTGVVKSIESRDKTSIIGIEFRFQEMEYIEYRGWGGSVENAIQQWSMQRTSDVTTIHLTD